MVYSLRASEIRITMRTAREDTGIESDVLSRSVYIRTAIQSRKKASNASADAHKAFNRILAARIQGP